MTTNVDLKIIRIKLANEYPFIRQMDDGTIIGVGKLITTVGLFVGLDEDGYRYRYCYRDLLEALGAFNDWNDKSQHPPGNWIVQKGLGNDLRNPDYNPRQHG